MTLKPPLGANFPSDALSRAEVLLGEHVNVKSPEFAARGDGSTDDTAALTLAFEAANDAGIPIYFPSVGDDHYVVSDTLPTLTSCPGIVGEPAGSRIYGDVDGDIIVLKGNLKVVTGLYVVNTCDSYTDLSACIRVQNCAYGNFSNLFLRNEDQVNENAVGFLLEQVNDGSEEDVEHLVHIGNWYNHLERITAMYLSSTSVNVGQGIAFRTDATAVSVNNPPGQPAGTYTGSSNFNEIVGCNVEGKARGLSLEYANNNTMIGGQFIQCTDQVYAENADANNFIGVKHNQWETRPYNLATASCYSNMILNPSLFDTGGSPYSLGIIGSRPMVIATDESTTEHGLTLNDSRLHRVDTNQLKVGPAQWGASDTSSDAAEFKEASQDTSSYALVQSTAGRTFVNAKTGQEVEIRINNTARARFSGTGFHLNGGAPVAPQALGAAATDLASVITLANNLRNMAINNGSGTA